MTQKIIRIGSSSGITLSKGVLKLANLKVGDSVLVEVLDNDVIIRPQSIEEDKRSLQKIERLLDKHKNELDKINE